VTEGSTWSVSHQDQNNSPVTLKTSTLYQSHHSSLFQHISYEQVQLQESQNIPDFELSLSLTLKRLIQPFVTVSDEVR
jgi:hypothetical protein